MADFIDLSTSPPSVPPVKRPRVALPADEDDVIDLSSTSLAGVRPAEHSRHPYSQHARHSNLGLEQALHKGNESRGQVSFPVCGGQEG